MILPLQVQKTKAPESEAKVKKEDLEVNGNKSGPDLTSHPDLEHLLYSVWSCHEILKMCSGRRCERRMQIIDGAAQRRSTQVPQARCD